jgi:DUF4097 and DUF4098 domain-containing protein YvlB
MDRTFDTTGHVSLYVELGSGDVVVRTHDRDQVVVRVHGDDADETTVEQRGDKIVVIGPQRRGGFFTGDRGLDVQVTVPEGTDLTTKLGSADLVAGGPLGAAALRSGSGDIRLETAGSEVQVESGSGDVTLGAVGGDLRAKAGSGDVTLQELGGSGTISTGSGDVEVHRASGDVHVKTGSGNLRVHHPEGDVSLSTASGDLTVDLMGTGQLAAKNVSGDIRVGVPGGVPVWTDISTLSGSVRSNLAGAGQPAEGQEFLELRAKTVSGDIVLEQR